MPPIHFHEELNLNLNTELLNITFTWQPPLGLVIDDDLMYVININVSIQNLTDDFQIEVITSNLSYTCEIMFKEREDFNISQICMLSSCLSYDIVYVIVDISLSSKNKVGTGMEVYKEILLDLLCTSAIPITTSDSG